MQARNKPIQSKPFTSNGIQSTESVPLVSISLGSLGLLPVPQYLLSLKGPKFRKYLLVLAEQNISLNKLFFSARKSIKHKELSVLRENVRKLE